MQKQVLAIHDLSCVGRCSLTVTLPILSACGVHTSALPTALLSTHTGVFTGYTYKDLTGEMRSIADHLATLPIQFDGVYSGFLGSFEQIELVGEVIRRYHRPGSLTLVDNDTVSITNINRQLYALRSTVGKSKVQVAKERIKDIDENILVHTYETFYNSDTADMFDFRRSSPHSS